LKTRDGRSAGPAHRSDPNLPSPPYEHKKEKRSNGLRSSCFTSSLQSAYVKASRTKENFFLAMCTHQKLPRILRVLCSMHLKDVRSYDYVNYVVPALHQLHCALRLLVTRLRGLYVNLAVRREYSSPGRSGSTSTTPYAAATSSSGRTTTSTTHLD
jgi:hypothetical protein